MEERVKQRLVGAIVLVALAVIFIPMILQGPSDGNGSGGNLPPPPQVVQHPLPAVPAPQQVPATPAEGAALPPPRGGSAPPADAGDGRPGSAGDSGAPAPVASPAPKPMPAPAAPVTSAPGVSPVPSGDMAAPSAAGSDAQLTAWVVQVGSFTRQDNAQALRDKLRTKGFKSFVQQAVTGQGAVYRVEVGPVLKHSDAEALRDSLQTQMQLKGIVTPHR